MPLKNGKKQAGRIAKAEADKKGKGNEQIEIHHYPPYSVESIVLDIKKHKHSRFNRGRCAMCG